MRPKVRKKLQVHKHGPPPRPGTGEAECPLTPHQNPEPRCAVLRRAARTSRAPPPRSVLTASSPLSAAHAPWREAPLIKSSRCVSFPRCARPSASRASSAVVRVHWGAIHRHTHSQSSLCRLAPCEINASTGSSNKFCISTDAAVHGASANQSSRRELRGWDKGF